MARDLFLEGHRRRNTRRFLNQPYRVLFAKSETGHWHGGPPQHRNARCFVCKKPLRLVWSIDLSDAELPDALRQAFPKLSRLPLYYCFNCPEATTYRVTSETALVCIDAAGHEGGSETPYGSETEVPTELPRLPISLQRIPSAIDGLIVLENELGFDGLDTTAQKELSKFVGRQLDSAWDFVYSQFGGQPPMVQGHWDIPCPDPKCPGISYKSRPGFDMKELAVAESDCLTGFQWTYAPLAFHVCWICGTIQGNFRCS